MRLSVLLASSSLATLSLATIVYAQSETENFTYDALGRLVSTEVIGGAGDNDTRTICYDKMGNRTEFMTRNDGSVPQCSATPTPSPTPTPTETPTPTPTPPPANNPPVAQNDSVTGECSAWRIVNVTANDSDPDGPAPLTVTNVVKTSGGANVLTFSGGIIEVVLGPLFDSSSFTYTVQDGAGATDTATLTTFTTSCSGGPPPP